MRLTPDSGRFRVRLRRVAEVKHDGHQSNQPKARNVAGLALQGGEEILGWSRPCKVSTTANAPFHGLLHHAFFYIENTIDSGQSIA